LRVYLITKEKKVTVKDVNGKEQFLFYNDGAYKLDGECVKLSFRGGRVNPEAELFFIENNPFPINKSDRQEMGMLEEVVIRNALENVVSISGQGLMGLFNKFSDWISNPKHMTALSVLFVAGVIVYGFISGGLKL
jgi:hypothetical protein